MEERCEALKVVEMTALELLTIASAGSAPSATMCMRTTRGEMKRGSLGSQNSS